MPLSHETVDELKEAIDALLALIKINILSSAGNNEGGGPAARAIVRETVEALIAELTPSP